MADLPKSMTNNLPDGADRDALSLRKLSQAMEQIADIVLIADRDGTIEYVNPAFEKATGYRRREVIGEKPNILCSGWHDADFFRNLWRVISNGGVFRDVVVNRRKDGAHYYEEKTITPLTDETGEVTHYVSTGKDVTERMRKEEELRKLSMAVEQSTNAIIITDRSGVIEYVNDRFTRVTGYSAREARGQSPGLLKSGKHPKSFYAELWACLNGGEVWRGEICNRRKDGGLFWDDVTISPIRDGSGTITHYLGIQEDITERRLAEERLNYLAYFDSLTGLPNRSLLQQSLEQTIEITKRKREQLAVLYLDLDRFKDINDSLGHDEGDRLLQQVGERLKATVRAEDLVARVGGDEFVLVLVEVGGEDAAARVAQKVVDRLREPFTIHQHEHYISASIGITVYPQDHAVVSGLLKNADLAMYQAKESGGNGYRFYCQEMGVRVLERMELELFLRHALARGEMEIYYQPQFDLSSGGLQGMEALLRWFHPNRGMVGPNKFIPIAESSGQIVELGSWALTRAYRQLVDWRAQGLSPPRVAVNLSPQQLAMPDLPSQVEDLLKEIDVEPQAVTLELTESALMLNPERAERVLRELKQVGVFLSLDDFGTGYSSLGRLRRFPLDCLKIDRSFIRDLAEDPDAQSLVAAIIRMAQSLGMMTIAEGVETRDELEFLKGQGCDAVQGYLLGRPMPHGMMGDLMRRQNGMKSESLQEPHGKKLEYGAA